MNSSSSLQHILLLALVLLLGSTSVLHAGDFSAELGTYFRYFPQDASDPRQHGNIGIVTLLGEYYHDWDNGDQRFAFTPYLRIYEAPGKRTDFDIQELYWRKSFSRAEFSVGVRKYFWGKSESVHLVDVLNQTDLVQDLDTEDKLGQPVIDLTLIRSWGDLSFYVLPYFRERRFPNAEGRPRVPLVIDTHNPVYESSAEEKHVDLALRWSHFIGAWDLGLSYFDGTNRNPRLVPQLNASGDVVLIPHYDQMRQFGTDIQATVGPWLWKFEAIRRHDRFESFTSAVTGFEYTLYGIGGPADLGLLVELLWDDRNERATTPFQHDVFLGARLAFNDVQSTELLAGVIYDPEDESRFALIEGSRRIGDRFKLELEGRFFSRNKPGTLLGGFNNDDYIEVSITTFF